MFKIFLSVFAIGFLMSTAHVTFTNLKCDYRNKSIGQFHHCHIKAVNRTHKYVSVYGKHNKRNINNVTKNQKSPFINLFYKPLKETSNFNHSCPYGEEIIVDKLWTGNHEADFLKYLPIPNGDYMLPFTVYSNNLEMLTIQVFLHLTT